MKKIIKIEPSAVGKILMRKRVAAYCRVSTGSDEQLESLETQKSHYEEYISSNPEWEYAGLYYDEGITGRRKDLRPALMQMMQDCEAGKIDVILTKSLSRFARNTMDCLELVRRLQELGITVYFEKENLNTEKMESELLLSVMSGLAQSESESMSQNNKWSVRRRFEDGTFKSCCAPFGYSIKDGVYSINEDEAKWVRFMFDNIVKGLSSHQVAQLLTENKVPTRKGGKWGSSTVCSILKNERYIGDCLFQKTCKDSHCSVAGTTVRLISSMRRNTMKPLSAGMCLMRFRIRWNLGRRKSTSTLAKQIPIIHLPGKLSAVNAEQCSSDI